MRMSPEGWAAHLVPRLQGVAHVMGWVRRRGGRNMKRHLTQMVPWQIRQPPQRCWQVSWMCHRLLAMARAASRLPWMAGIWRNKKTQTGKDWSRKSMCALRKRRSLVDRRTFRRA